MYQVGHSEVGFCGVMGGKSRIGDQEPPGDGGEPQAEPEAEPISEQSAPDGPPSIAVEEPAEGHSGGDNHDSDDHNEHEHAHDHDHDHDHSHEEDHEHDHDHEQEHAHETEEEEEQEEEISEEDLLQTSQPVTKAHDNYETSETILLTLAAPPSQYSSNRLRSLSIEKGNV
ncbi:zinc transporter zipt-7.2-like [Sabethes cyaneus]|uniref:zinc transporter zipt-7.2-like n=1 Tax=Sabethes cyaneus TaxID=53552 RepID=UPI00237D42C2|nr:zinc transporter zipt-7.2-like [Sabethes cyaneus]